MAYAMAVEPSGFEPRANTLLEKTDIIASTPHILENLATPTFISEDNPRAKSMIGLLQVQMQRESKMEWPLKCIPRAWQAPTALEATESKHPFPNVNVPATVTTTVRPLLPEVYFSIYDNSEIETVPPTSDIAATIMRDAIVDTINILDFNRNAAAKCLIDLDCYYKPGTFIARATPFDKLREQSGDGSTWKTEDVAVDAVFSQLLKLPASEHKEVYHHALLTELCKLAPAAIAPSLGRAIRFLYRDLDTMDLELNYRFMDWFTHHLSNFGFTWKWTEW
jgi:nuclear cap-binding protein subunit 1